MNERATKNGLRTTDHGTTDNEQRTTIYDMKAIWAICACAGCVTALAATQVADFPVFVVLTAVLTMALTWL